MKRRILWMVLDLTIAALFVAATWIAEYKIPKNGLKMEAVQKTQVKKITADSIPDWRKKFTGKFSDETIATDTSYSSPNLAIQLSYNNYDSGILDMSMSGKHRKYGTRISYVIADIYVGDITCFQTVFAQNAYGVGYSEKLSDMSERMQAVLAVNGDSYSSLPAREHTRAGYSGLVF